MRRASIHALSMRGRVRARNEDCVGVGGWLLAAEIPVGFEVKLERGQTLLIALADGMGGHPGGDVASLVAVKTLLAHGGALFDERAFRAAIADADAALASRMQAEPELSGMGTTLAALALDVDRTIHCNLGDSRIYRIFDGYLRQMSVEDTASDERDEHGHRSGLITGYLGGRDRSRPPTPHIACEPLNPPSRWLLCSDGLTDMVSDAEIEAVLCAPDPQALLEMSDLAMRAGGVDNISIVLATIS